ncbi:hypothetical protein FSP39_020762 [Pinctada imbricata]|uniref:RNA polymerase II-associated protein 1 n=1 Tax=Pinctada imbricata TaxID=66713 RepID=A0AA89C3Y6_PINIB|nr:hypothetical protein FSP39_020762 [Pinctada imbricata]
MIPRPKPGESEEDLLRFQQEFLASQKSSSASIVKRPDKRKSDESNTDGKTDRDVVQIGGFPSEAPKLEPSPPSKKSKFRSRQEETKQVTMETDDPEERLDKHDTHMAAVLSKIIERDTQNAQVNMPVRCAKGFPSVFHAEHKHSVSSNSGKKSLFAQQISNMSPPDLGLIIDQEVFTPTSGTSKVQKGKPEVKEYSHVIEGTGISATFGKEEAQKIHHENLQKLQQMGEEEILEEQQKLLQMLDPKLVSFLKSKKSSNIEEKKEESIEEPEEMSHSHSSKKPEVIIDESEIPVQPSRDWVHMDQVEHDKLSWMKDLPPPQAGDSKTGQQARFDFHGNLVPTKADIPVNIGLHHHGDEPERAGYTLEELFHLSRSTNIQQRCLALKTLAHILQKARNRELEKLIQSPLLPAVLDAGIMFLLRWSLDDQVDAVVFSAISTLHSLLICQADEEALDRTFPWFQGHVRPSHKPVEESQEMTSPQNIDEDKPQETDADVFKKDVILCLVTRMNILPRLKYILTKSRPQAPTIIQIISILTRIAHHSPNLAYEIDRFSGLLEFIIEEFLPTSWRTLDCKQPISDVYGIPVPAAMRMIRILAQSGRHLASLLVSKYHITARFLRYLVEVNPRDLQLPEGEAYQLQTESFRAWRVFLSYGLCDTLFIDMFTSVLSKINNIQHIISHDPTDVVIHNLVAMVGAIEMVVMVASSTSNRRMGTFNMDRSTDSSVSEEEIRSSTLNWGHVAELGQLMSKVTETLLQFTGQNYQFKRYDLDLVVACVNFMSSYFTALSSQKSLNPVSILPIIKAFTRNILFPSLKTMGIQTTFQYVSQHSNLLDQSEIKNERSAALPDLGTGQIQGDNCVPVVQKLSPIGFTVSILRLANSICHIHKGLQREIVQCVVGEENLCSYHRKMATQYRNNGLRNNHFTMFENLLQYFYLKILTLDTDSIGEERKLTVTMLQTLTLNLLTRIHHGNEFIVHDILSTVLFNVNLWRSHPEDMSSALEELTLSDATKLRSATQEEVTFTQGQLVTMSRSSLAEVRATYIRSMSVREKVAIHSRQRILLHPFDTESLTTPYTEENLLPQDWIFMPLIDLYNRFSLVGADIQSALSTSELGTVTSVLKWIYLLERSQSQYMSSISPTLKISRIMCTFLTGNDLFLDRTVYCYLAALLREYTSMKLLDKMDFEEEIPGLVSFYDLYVAFLQQYEAVSFGDSLFGCYVMIPLQQRHNLQLRKAIWTEHYGILRILHLPLKESLIPIQAYLEPEETDVELVRLYFQGLLSQTVRSMWSPLMYLIAVHHVNRFMYNQDQRNGRLRRLMVKQSIKCPHQELRRHLLFYKLYNKDLDFGMELYEELPPLRKSYIDGLGGSDT